MAVMERLHERAIREDTKLEAMVEEIPQEGVEIETYVARCTDCEYRSEHSTRVRRWKRRSRARPLLLFGRPSPPVGVVRRSRALAPSRCSAAASSLAPW